MESAQYTLGTALDAFHAWSDLNPLAIIFPILQTRKPQIRWLGNEPKITQGTQI